MKKKIKDSPLTQMLRKKGYNTKQERLVHLWKMFHETYMILTEIGEEIEKTEGE